ncbi:hypothetical protein AVEN_46597-1 [Araneus ventricosus]|uniref:Uncharacterized protein n=1 Tax=Araneus ventricosus TaxID=182803 RepID=A0A4Y2NN35_ARAVE|nr:hypothetical protein AVEN_46597-1 [Araneus ventricosus]
MRVLKVTYSHSILIILRQDLEVIFPKFSEIKIGPFMGSLWSIGRFNNMSEQKFEKIRDHKRHLDASGMRAKHRLLQQAHNLGLSLS